jgi:hypothetical protein
MAGIVEIGKDRWLAGMTWLAYETSPSKADLREDAGRQNADWVSVRNASDFKQAGFCPAIEGEKLRKLNSLAAKLAESKQQPWLGIFRIADNLSWYIAVRDNHTILPDGDVLGTDEDMRLAQERHAGYIDWNHVKGDLTDLEAMIKLVDEKSSPIKAISGMPPGQQVAIGAAVATTVLVAGGFLWWKHQQALAQAHEMAVSMQRERQRLAHFTAAPKAPPPPSLPILPPPSSWLHACGAALLDLPLSNQAWALTKPSCSQTSASITWLRGEGATLNDHPDCAVSANGDTCVEAIPFTALEAREMDDLLTSVEASVRFRQWTQTVGFKVTLPPAAPPPQPLPGADKPAPPAFTQTAVTLDMPISPFSDDVGRALDAIPGLRLSSASMTDTGWSLQGVLYGR